MDKTGDCIRQGLLGFNFTCLLSEDLNILTKASMTVKYVFQFQAEVSSFFMLMNKGIRIDFSLQEMLVMMILFCGDRHTVDILLISRSDDIDKKDRTLDIILLLAGHSSLNKYTDGGCKCVTPHH